MIRITLLILILVFLFGCQSKFHASSVEPYHSYSLDGEILAKFEADEKTTNIDGLLWIMKKNIKDSFNELGLESARLVPDYGKQWALLTFTYKFIDWKLGVQFIHKQEDQNIIFAIIRGVGTMDDIQPNPSILIAIEDKIGEGLMRAGDPAFELK